MSKKEIADALNEIRFLASIRHKNIVGFLEAFLENNETELCIVMVRHMPENYYSDNINNDEFNIFNIIGILWVR